MSISLEEFKTLLPYERYTDKELAEALILLENLAHICLELEEEI
jgi:hypothetical protein